MSTRSLATLTTLTRGQGVDVVGIGGGTASRVDLLDSLVYAPMCALAAVLLHVAASATLRRVFRWKSSPGLFEACLFGIAIAASVPAFALGASDQQSVPKGVLATVFLPWLASLYLEPRRRGLRARVTAEIQARSERSAVERGRSLESLRGESAALRLEIERIRRTHPASAERAEARGELEAARAELDTLRRSLSEMPTPTEPREPTPG